MTTGVLPVASTGERAAAARPSTVLAQARLSWRLIRRASAAMWLAVATYNLVEVLVFRSAYPDRASRQSLLDLSTSQAVRMLQGTPGAIDTAGGFAVWDAGWMLMLIVGSWALVTATKLLRGEEDAGRADVVLSRPLTERQLLLANMSAVAAALVGLGLATALPYVVLTEPPGGAFLWGAALGTFGAVIAALGALLSQLFAPRRRVLSFGFAVTTAVFLLRVTANSAPQRAWLLTATPFGWADRARPYTDNAWWWLGAPIAAALAMGAGAVYLSGRRDVGAATFRAAARRVSNVRLLTSAPAFGWRLTSGTLLVWAAILGVTNIVFGLMVDAFADFVAKDDSYRRLIESVGIDTSAPIVGFLSYVALATALPVAAFTGWRLGAAWREERSGRLDDLLGRGIVRWRWLTATALQALAATTTLVLAAGLGLWAGSRLVGAPVSAGQVAEPMLGMLPLTTLFVGLAVLAFGAVPRLTIPAPVTLAVVGYLVDAFGTSLGWPPAVLALSPFHHLARLPNDPLTLPAATAMLAVGVGAAALGVYAFTRRDVHGT